MGSTVRTITKHAETEPSAFATLRWRSWPVVDCPQWSWILPGGLLGIGAFMWWLGGGWLLGLTVILALALALWQFLLPVTFEFCSLGVRRYALGRVRLVPWEAIRAYQLRTSGVVFFQHSDPTTIDVVKSLFVPYPIEEDEVVAALRPYLPHAAELP